MDKKRIVLKIARSRRARSMIFRALKNRNVQRMLALLIVRLVKRRFRRS